MEAYKYNVQTSMMEIVEVKSYKDIQATLAFRHEEPVTFTAFNWQVGDTPVTVYVDDEGLLKEEKAIIPYVNELCNSVVYNNDISTPLVGNMLFAMHNEEGEMIDCTADPDEIEMRIYPYSSVQSVYQIQNATATEILLDE